MDSKKVLNNFIWRFLENFGNVIFTVVIGIILARVLDVEAYALVAIVSIFIAILQVFVDSGLGSALIQKKEADDLDFSTVFFFNIFICTILYLILFLFAPLIAKAFKFPELTTIIRVLGITLLISGVKNIQQAYISKNMLFKKFFFASLLGTICAGIVGIVLALTGYGVWALVWEGLTNAFVDTVFLWFSVKWRPKLMFSFSRLKTLLKYSWKLLVSSLIDTTYGKVRETVIGLKYTKNDLSYYNQGKNYPEKLINIVNSSITSVLFPSMSSEQQDVERVKQMTRRSIKISSYFIMPAMVGLAVCATAIISLILTDKWLGCVPYMQIYCMSFSFYAVHTANLNAMKALGKSGTYLILEIIKKVIGLTAIIISMNFGVMAIALSLLAVNLLSMFINAFPNKKFLNYGYWEQLKDLLPTIFITLLMGAIVYCVSFIGLSNWLTLLIQVPLGVVLYVLFSHLFKLESYTYSKQLIFSYFKNKREKDNIEEDTQDNQTQIEE